MEGGAGNRRVVRPAGLTQAVDGSGGAIGTICAPSIADAIDVAGRRNVEESRADDIALSAVSRLDLVTRASRSSGSVAGTARRWRCPRLRRKGGGSIIG